MSDKCWLGLVIKRETSTNWCNSIRSERTVRDFGWALILNSSKAQYAMEQPSRDSPSIQFLTSRVFLLLPLILYNLLLTWTNYSTYRFSAGLAMDELGYDTKLSSFMSPEGHVFIFTGANQHGPIVYCIWTRLLLRSPNFRTKDIQKLRWAIIGPCLQISSLRWAEQSPSDSRILKEPRFFLR